MKYLIVVDMQNDFIDGALGSDDAKAIVPNVVKKIKSFKDYITFFTADTHDGNYLNTQEGRNLPIEHCINGTHGWEISKEIQAAFSKEHAILPFEKSAFGSIELAEFLWKCNKESPIEEIVVVGLCTDICVVSNALLIKSFLPETKISVDASCCAGITKQSHDAALLTMKMCQINIENWN